jgi:anti-sigma factor RsiW
MAFTRSAVRSRLAPPLPSSVRMREPRRRTVELPPFASPSVVVGALALGALAIGALAIGALAIGRLRILRVDADKVRLGTVEIDDLTVRRLRVIEDEPPESREGHAG